MAVVFEQGESFEDLQKKNTIQNEDEDVGFFESALAGVATGLWNIPKGFVSLGAEVYDLVADTNTAKDVEKWFDDVKMAHEETYDLIDRTKHGEFFTVRGIVDLEDLFMNHRISDCPYMMYMYDDIIEFIVLALNEDDAKRRVEKYIDNIYWVDL